jgi:dihydroxy-acid dehydratase
MEAGNYKGQKVDLINSMVMGADPSISDAELEEIEGLACPSCLQRNVYRKQHELPK